MVAPMPTTDVLRPLEKRVLSEIQAAGGQWVTRADVSRRLGRPRTYPTDVAALEKLVLLGLIEAREGTRGAVALRWEYRVTSEE